MLVETGLLVVHSRVKVATRHETGVSNMFLLARRSARYAWPVRITRTCPKLTGYRASNYFPSLLRRYHSLSVSCSQSSSSSTRHLYTPLNSLSHFVLQYEYGKPRGLSGDRLRMLRIPIQPLAHRRRAAPAAESEQRSKG